MRNEKKQKVTKGNLSPGVLAVLALLFRSNALRYTRPPPFFAHHALTRHLRL